MKMTSNIKTDEDELENEDVPKILTLTQKQFCPPPHNMMLPEFF